MGAGDRSTKILVADDDQVLADSIGEILRRVGLLVAIEYCGTDAVSSARFFRPSVLLVDIVMPGLNGVEAAIRIRRFLPSCRVLLHTGLAEGVRLWETARARGFAFEMLPKPASPSVIVETVAQLGSE